MAKYVPSKYYADDKDLHDILSSGKISMKALLSVARRRGIFLSEESPREELVNYISKLPFGWTDIQALMDLIEREDREEKITTCKIQTKASIEQVETALQKLKELRGESQSESYQIIQSKDNRIQVKVGYYETDFQKTRTIQRRERDLVVDLQNEVGGYAVRHTQNERANLIVAELLNALTPGEAEKPLRRSIELSVIKNPEHRTRFFIHLVGGIEGFQLREVKDLKVDRLAPEEVGGIQTAAGEHKKEVDQLKSMVRRVALSGENILVSPQYQQLSRDGFFISRAVWTSVETAGKGRVFEFEAEFKDSENAKDFAYQVRGVFDRDKDGNLSGTRSAVSDPEKEDLKKRIETTAFESLDQTIAAATSSDPTTNATQA